MEPRLLLAATPLLRIDAGGPDLGGSPAWTADTSGAPSPYVNVGATGNYTYPVTSAINLSDASVPAGTPAGVFQNQRWDPAGGAEMQWSIPVTPGQYQVRLYFAETYDGAFGVGKRKFNVQIEGSTVLSNYDIYADVGADKGVTKTFTVNSDSTLNINFGHVVENPTLAGIEILSTSGVVPVGFGKSTLGGTGLTNPSSLQWGPDGRLYVAQQDGTIKIFSVKRNSANSYSLTGTQTITSIRDIPNHNDDGSLNASINTRQVTGLYVTGTAANPVIFVTSSDPRIGGGSSAEDTGLDTNSGILSKLTWNGSSWVKQDLVRGMPRSEENHSQNGMVLDPATNTLYVTSGGNTNMGAPSNNFAFLPEFALSTAILSINLSAIGSGTYDLPTLDDENRPGTNDANDPFGGNDGKNQAKLVPGGPVQIYASGLRNAYDVIITSSGRMYTIDNGANAGWGDVPIGSGASVTNQVHEPGITTQDGLHLITAGYYAGHPNPTRANPNNKFNASNPQSPVTTGNPQEGYFLSPGVNNGALALYPASTNGLAEYTASNFGGAMKGNLLAASFDNKIYRVQLNGSGDSAISNGALFSSVGQLPLDVTAMGDGGLFPGTIWVADYQTSAIYVFEPNDFGGAGGGGGTGADDPNLDDDHDTYNNHDEIVNGTNPLSAADVPPDWDFNPNSPSNDSNLIDPDDDNDGKPDTSDPFAIDAANGRGTNLPISYTWDNNVPKPGKLLSLGFTGLMTNGSANYESLFDAGAVTAGGAAGVFTIDQVGDGTALGSTNTQAQAFQFGVNVNQSSGQFIIHTRILGPFSGLTPQAGQEMGVYFGNGDQDNYAELVVTAGGLKFVKEVGGAATTGATTNVTWPGPDAVDLYLTVDPAAATIQPAYTTTSGGVTSGMINVGGAQSIPAAWFCSATAPAVGLIGTSAGPAPTFPVTYDLVEVTPVGSAGPGSSPYGGTPFALPGTLQAENFDLGGEGVAYHDLDSANLGGAFRSGEGVDLETTTDSGGGYDVGWIQAGEWAQYTLQIPASGDYTMALRVASAGAGGTLHVEFDGIDKTGSITIPNTGGWQNWTTISKTVNLPAGTRVMRLVFDTNGSTSFVGNINWIQFTGPIGGGGGGGGTGQTPFKGTPFNVGDTIQSEDFDNGGEGVAFHDLDSANQGGAYRNTAVDIQATTDAGGGYNVGWGQAGEWLEYTLNVPSAGNYNIAVRVANTAAGGKFHIEFGGVNKTGSISVPSTGNWQGYQTVTINNVSLSAGQQVMRLALDTNASAGFVGNFNWIQVTSAGPVQQQGVTGLTLINADTNQPIGGFSPIANGATIDLSALPTRNLNIRADTIGAIGSIKFALDGNSNYRVESAAPYALAGDVNGDFGPWTPSVGSHTITATPYSGAGATGTAGTPFTITFNVVDGTPQPGPAEALVQINPSGGINASTYNSGSFKIVNNSAGGQKITSVTFDMRTGILFDMVFDPNGQGGDTVAKAFTVDSLGGTGFTTTQLSSLHDGGYDVLKVNFNGFDAGEQFTFSIDQDPTSIKGTTAPGPNESGSVSGLEQIGGTVTVNFSDGTSVSGRLWRIPNSLQGSQVVLKTGLPAAPSIGVLGVGSGPATVSSANQTVRVSAAAGSQVSLVVMEAGLFTAGLPNAGFDIDPYEANSALGIAQYTATVGAGGYVDIPIVLAKTNTSGGLNEIMAVLTSGGLTGITSQTITLKLN